jgi:hypothetical protein
MQGLIPSFETVPEGLIKKTVLHTLSLSPSLSLSEFFGATERPRKSFGWEVRVF